MVADEEIRAEILGVVVDEFRNQDSTVSMAQRRVVNEVTHSLNVSKGDVVSHLRRLNDEGLIARRPSFGAGSVRLEAAGVERYEELTGDTVVPRAAVSGALETLADAERDDPHTPWLSRRDLLARTDVTEGELDRAMWFGTEKQLVDTERGFGSSWQSATISHGGRQRVET